jgi:hypothetical protein
VWGSLHFRGGLWLRRSTTKKILRHITKGLQRQTFFPHFVQGLVGAGIFATWYKGEEEKECKDKVLRRYDVSL